MRFFREKWGKVLAIFMVYTIFFEMLFPMSAMALNGGPSQPEVSSFEPIGTSEMVDMFSGDFMYNIPLMDVGGYPINIAYSGGVGMDQEATWCGLGWNINPGVINRNKRGNADDWKGDIVTRNYNIKGSQTFGASVGVNAELLGLDFAKLAESVGLSVKFNFGVSHNNYSGTGVSVGVSPALNATEESKGPLTGSLGLNASSSGGVSLSPSIGLRNKMENGKKKDVDLRGNIGLSINSREGFKSLTIGYSAGYSMNKPVAARKNKNKVLSGGGGSVGLDFTTPTYVLKAGMPTINIAATFTANAGAEIFGAEPNVDITANYSGSFLAKSKRESEAYGYMYEQHSDYLDIKDFNRENDNAYTKLAPNLPVTNHTYDVFSVAGQGVGGMYRPFRNDVGIVHDPSVVSLGKAALDKETGVENTGNTSISISAGLEAASGNLAKMGVNVSLTTSASESGLWQVDNELDNAIGFRSADKNSLDEVVYFKQAGEKSVDEDWDIFENLGGYEAAQPVIDARFFGGYANRRIKTESGVNLSLTKDKVKRKTRRRRNQGIRFKTADEAQFNALIKQVESYDLGDHTFDTKTGQYIKGANSKNRTDYKPHHISEVEVVRPDGVRYIYGIPAYNTHQEDATFAVGEMSSPDCGSGLVEYSHDEASKDNKSGNDNLFDQTVLPPYAHSYMLTAIVSADYVDITGDGPTDDDLGTYTRLNYSKVYGEGVANGAYKWRSPYYKNKANHNEGLKSMPYPAQGVDPITLEKIGHKSSDDKGTYSYGEKDIWYVHSIVTKNYVADFELSQRKDAASVVDKYGGMDATKSMYKLNTISLYSKADKMKLGANATPLKMVHFEYDYSLCKNIPNNNGGAPDANELSNDGGKLTLKRIFFTYENSNKAVLNSYKFNYSKFNPSYDVKGYDKWGNYKPNPATQCKTFDPLSTSEFPYTDQDKSKSDAYAAAWSLDDIQLPSGGRIKVEYEADDYAYVQNRRAMEMVKICGAGSNLSDGENTITSKDDSDVGGAELYNGSAQNYMFFKLPTPVKVTDSKNGIHSLGSANTYFRKRYTDGIDNMYFRFLGRVNARDNYEFVSGYADITNSGLLNKTFDINGELHYTHGYVALKKVGYDDNNGSQHPIAKAIWQFTRLQLPRIAYSQPDPEEEGFVAIVKALGSSLKQLGQFITGFNVSMKIQGYGKLFVKNKSWIRLMDADYKKLGGGSRVKKVAMSDEWGELVAGESSYEYGQEYNYEKEVPINGVMTSISSGVATYEPSVGGDENPFRQPIFMEKKQILAPDNRNYVEEPLGESFFPGASIGYSVRDIKRTGVTKNATGKVVHTFATAKEYPTIVTRTDVTPKKNTPARVLKFLKLRNVDLLSVSQGFKVELNDMHGKTSGQKVYAEGKLEPISSTQYIYKTQMTKDYDDNWVQGLSNKTNVLYKFDGSGNNVKQKTIGVDYDVVADMRTSTNTTRSMTTDGQIDGFLILLFPGVFPTVLPGYSKEKVNFKSATLTKVINRYSLVDEVIARDLGSVVSTENLLYDANTGEILLTKTVNGFDDPIYSFTVPAHFAYDKMSMAYKNLGYSLEQVSLSSLGDYAKNFVVGDELLLDQEVVWVTNVDKAGGTISVIARDGTTNFSGVYDIVINRSGRRNQQSLPVGSIVTRKNPLRDINGDEVDNTTAGSPVKLVFEEILNAGATEFTDEWQVSCNCGLNPSAAGENEFLRGAIGNFRPKRSWVYLTDRSKSVKNNNTNIREDGTFEKFSPFWTMGHTSSEDWKPNPGGWQFTTEVSYFNMHGLELENTDALGRYSTALYGYYFSLPSSVSNNSKTSDVGFDSFEDYNEHDCEDDHFSYRKFKYNLTEKESHTGRFSIKVLPKSEVEVRKVIQPCD